MNRSSIIFSLAVALVALPASLATLSGCTDNPVGRICDLGTDVPNPNDNVVASPSLDCVSRSCLRVPLTAALPEGSRYPEGNKGLCTAECSADSDCDRVPESPCTLGFTCQIAVNVGPFCCQKFCICKDYFVIPTTIDPQCDPTNPAATCPNLPGN